MRVKGSEAFAIPQVTFICFDDDRPRGRFRGRNGQNVSPLGRPRRAEWRPKHFHTVCLGGTYPYLALGPLNGPLRHSWSPKRARFGPKRLLWAPVGQIWSQLSLIDLVSGPFWDWGQKALFGPPAAANLAPQALLGPPGTPGALKGPVLAQNACFGGLKKL